MKKKIYQIITVLIIIILFTVTHSKSLEAVPEGAGSGGSTSGSGNSSSSITLDKIIGDADTFLEAGEGSNKFKEGSIEDMIKSIYNILLVMGTIAVVIVGIILSIQFITGGLEEQAKVKEMFVPYVAGSIVIFASFTIWKIVVDILQSL